jgi:hypothetical protein
MSVLDFYGARILLAEVAHVWAEWCRACKHHHRVHRVPCIEHTPKSTRTARARAIGVTR